MILSFRFGLSTAAVLFIAVVAKLSASLVTEFTVSQVPLIWTLVASWLEPPYLYLVINCIIITIFASSKFQKHATSYYTEPNKFSEDDYYCSGHVLQSALVEVMQPHSRLDIMFKYQDSDEFDLNEIADDSLAKTRSLALVKDVQVDDSNTASDPYSGKSITASANFEEINDNNIILEHPVNKMPKLPSSAKFVHHKIINTDSKGRRGLRVSKSKQELDTMENTWNTITKGRVIQLTREHTSCGNLQDRHKMIDSETLNEQNSSHRIDNMSKRLARSCGPGKLSRDPSLNQDELNKRAEAFINRFKEDMRLQRKESLNRYVEAINRSTY